MKTIKILFQGDSITDGNRNKDEELRWDGNHQIGHSYVFSVCGMLALENPHIHYIFENRGISGNKVSDILKRIDNDIIEITPDIMTLFCGINDGPTWESIYTAPDEFEQHYSKILKICKEKLPHTKIILLEPVYFPVKPHDQFADIWNKLLPEYRQKIKQLANKYNCEYIELQKEFDKMTQYQNQSYWLWDGIHPTECGHGIIAHKVFKALKKYT